ncbi:hypothetical protein SAMN04487947_1248 [Halogeometricum rufum]|uniref:Uncharacterized protein n=1 Tax=Halogeometricum rufum TaxID=553469 RepID=A0A1I6GJB9_9EURY|nr:hypothetical protein [Halogeometricum rufum]SFR42295.1 hypothetical protein SAMN04487947_1248 [Halogeometricum rufum]
MSQTAGAELVWEQKLDEASAKLADDTTAAALADEYGGEPDYVDDLCSEAVMVAFDEHADRITMDHFATAADRLDAEPSNDDTTESKRTPPHAQTESAGQVVATTTDLEEGTAADIDLPAETATDTNAAQRIDALESEVDELRALVEALHKQVKAQNRALTGQDRIDSVDADAEEFVPLLNRLDAVTGGDGT